MKDRRAYPKYKPSGVEWLGEVPEHWEIMALKRIVSTPVTDGPHETPEIYDDGIPFVSAEAIKNDKIDFSKIRGFISVEDHRRYSIKYRPQRNDIYIIKSGATTGNVAMVETDDEFNIWSPLAAIRPSRKISFPRFLFHYVKSKEFLTSIQLSWSFGTQQNIGMSVIENLVVTLPPLPEQQAIAAFLDRETGRIDTLVAKKEHLIELLREKRSALISAAVTGKIDVTVGATARVAPTRKMKPSGVDWLGDVPEHWEVKKLKFAFWLSRGVDLPAESFLEGPFPVYGSNGVIGYHDEFTTKGPCVVIGRSGSVGEVNYAEECFWAHNTALYIQDFRGTIPRFSYYLLLTIDLKSLSAGSAVGTLNRNYIHDVVNAVPPLSEQHAIAAFLDRETGKIDALIAKAGEAVAKLKEFRTALISAAVTGKIDVREAA